VVERGRASWIALHLLEVLLHRMRAEGVGRFVVVLSCTCVMSVVIVMMVVMVVMVVQAVRIVAGTRSGFDARDGSRLDDRTVIVQDHVKGHQELVGQKACADEEPGQTESREATGTRIHHVALFLSTWRITRTAIHDKIRTISNIVNPGIFP